MSIDPFDPLNEEERKLARMLGAGRRDVAPTPAMDTAILAAAHAAIAPAVDVPVMRTSQRHDRWNHGWRYGGIAAACVLALGITWKSLDRPAPVSATDAPAAEVAAVTAAPAPDLSSASASAEDTPAVDADARETSEPEVNAVPVRAPARAKAAAVAASEPRVDEQGKVAEPVRELEATAASEKAREPAKLAIPASAPPVPDAVVVTGSAAVQSAPARPSAAPASAARTEARMPEARSAPAANTAAAAQSAAAAAANDAARDVAPAPPALAAERIQTTRDAQVENGYDAAPPKTTGSVEVQQAWLKRIRALLAEGKREEAATSLAAWRKRYPDATVPTDLQPLQKVTPP